MAALLLFSLACAPSGPHFLLELALAPPARQRQQTAVSTLTALVPIGSEDLTASSNCTYLSLTSALVQVRGQQDWGKEEERRKNKPEERAEEELAKALCLWSLRVSSDVPSEPLSHSC